VPIHQLLVSLLLLLALRLLSFVPVTLQLPVCTA
jgi:hypothetical protein